jgi:hypothetical protein
MLNTLSFASQPREENFLSAFILHSFIYHLLLCCLLKMQELVTHGARSGLFFTGEKASLNPAVTTSPLCLSMK